MTPIQSRWARYISNLLCPPVVWGLLILPIAFRYAETSGQAFVWSLVYIALVCLLPGLYIFWMVRRGSISDIHMQFRQERFWPFVVSITCAAGAWGILQASGAPPPLPLVAVFTLVQLAVMMLITLTWQISMHAMSISGAVVATGIFFGFGPALLLSPLLPLVGTARLRLERHTLAQVVAGSLLGALVTVGLFFVL